MDESPKNYTAAELAIYGAVHFAVNVDDCDGFFAPPDHVESPRRRMRNNP